MYYVYILFSNKKKSLYKGSTSDLRNRFSEHNRGKVKSTANGIPWKIIHYQVFRNKTDALREELFFKIRKRTRKNKILASRNNQRYK